MTWTLHLLRHGQTGGSRDGLFCGASHDIALTDNGHAMAQAFAAHYRNFAWTAVIASPLQRAVSTATPLCEAAGLVLRTHDALREVDYGQWDGLGVPEVQQRFGEDYGRWLADPAWNAPTGGETATAVAARVLGFLQGVRAEMGERPGHVLAVAHKATVRIALCALLGVDLATYRQRFDCPVASLSSVEFGRQGPMLRRMGDQEHLPAALRS